MPSSRIALYLAIALGALVIAYVTLIADPDPVSGPINLIHLLVRH